MIAIWFFILLGKSNLCNCFYQEDLTQSADDYKYSALYWWISRVFAEVGLGLAKPFDSGHPFPLSPLPLSYLPR